jgi:ribonuclease HII
MKHLSPTTLASLTVQELSSLLETTEIDIALLIGLRSDPRAGVRVLADRFERRLERDRKLSDHEESLASMERGLVRDGCRLVAGLDEAGRGPLAGPVVAASVILPVDCGIRGIDDSKKLTPGKRQALYGPLTEQAVAWGVGIVEHDEIDEIGIGEATLKAMRVALTNMGMTPDIALIDGNRSPSVGCRERLVVNGDGLCRVIAAASIIAKVTRDRIMLGLDRKYPGYGFAGHKGYGVDDHIAAIRQLGPCDIHRFSFGVVNEAAPMGTGVKVLERRLANAPTRASFERAAAGIARMKENLREEDIVRLRDCYIRIQKKFRKGIDGR